MERFIRYCLVLTIASSLVSVFLAGVFLGCALLGWVIHCVHSRRIQLRFPPFFPFVLAFVVASVIAIGFSEDPVESLRYCKKFTHFLAVGLVFRYFSRDILAITSKSVFMAATVSAGVGVFQYFVEGKVSLLGRATGLMSHWMTFAGQLMMASLLLTGYLAAITFFNGKRKERVTLAPAGIRAAWFWLTALFLMLFALLLSLTRSGWFGFLAGLVILLAIRNYRLLLVAAGVGVLLVMVMPGRLSSRLASTFDPADHTNQVRIELLRTGRNVIAANPYWGIGPRMVSRKYREYRESTEFPGWAYQHLHNNVVQIAAEMGLFALAAWLGIWLKIGWDLVRFLREARTPKDRLLFWTSAGGLACLVAFLTAGLFEYNFGDSEILALLLFALTAPYVAARKVAGDKVRG